MSANSLMRNIISVEKYPELVFLDKIICFVNILYYRTNDISISSLSTLPNPFSITLQFLKCAKIEDLLTIILSSYFNELVIRYFCSRFHLTKITHIHTQLYNIPITFCRNNDDDCMMTLAPYFVFFDGTQVSQLIVSSYKLFTLYDGESVNVSQSVVDNKTADKRITAEEYKFLLSTFEATPRIGSTTTTTTTTQLSTTLNRETAESKADREQRMRHAECMLGSTGLYKQLARSNFKLEKNINFTTANGNHDDQQQITFPENPLQKIFDAIKSNKELFNFLTTTIQIFESFQFVDEAPLPETKSIDVYMKQVTQTYAKTRFTK